MGIPQIKDTKLYVALDFFNKSEIPFIKSGSLDNYCTYIRAIQFDLTEVLHSEDKILEGWILHEITQSNKLNVFNLLKNVTDTFDKAFEKEEKIGRYEKTDGQYDKSDCKSALIAFTKFILGQYKANLYLSLEQNNDEENCKLVARNALFCTVEVAGQIKSGNIGSKDNTNHPNGNGKGNKYYSWFACKFQRLRSAKKSESNKGERSQEPPQPDPAGIGFIIYDDNSAANEAIKKAIIKGFPEWMRCKYDNFKDYEACHIWDETCYEHRFHTSVFNLVLLPRSIAGLTDHCSAVKEILQYEAAMRFGVYPDGYGYKLSQSAQKIYNKIKHWRQPDEHSIALTNIQNKVVPTPLK